MNTCNIWLQVGLAQETFIHGLVHVVLRSSPSLSVINLALVTIRLQDC